MNLNVFVSDKKKTSRKRKQVRRRTRTTHQQPDQKGGKHRSGQNRISGRWTHPEQTGTQTNVSFSQNDGKSAVSAGKPQLLL